ncbi:I78 family peptidase inhibitor [Amaricoccus sp.]|uniref:I78 family peptidase inhibitor n=1 Tax=Amaricoccus sp. TaxID=1872485 RepID=UPI001B53F989|nr:I78 family peptidase inhibitor [Amaricoccus sp.]MBP7002419.1 hypothetical protein [Amaricoccus sp.]
MTKTYALAAAALLAGLAACTQEGADGTAAAAPGASADACGAAGLQSLVGTSVGSLDASALPEPRRVIFPGQPVTMDYREDRLNVEIGKDDKIARVYCG